MGHLLHPLYRQVGAAEPTLPILEGALGIVVACFAWELYLLLRQRRMYSVKEVPPSISDALLTTGSNDNKTSAVAAGIHDRFEKSQRYGSAKSMLGLVQHFLGVITSILTLYAGVLPFLFDTATKVLEIIYPMYAGAEIPTTIVFLNLAMLVTWAVGLPLSLYRTFFLEESFGFNKQVLAAHRSGAPTVRNLRPRFAVLCIVRL